MPYKEDFNYTIFSLNKKSSTISRALYFQLFHLSFQALNFKPLISHLFKFIKSSEDSD
jgi:hypothetical protein